MKSIAIFISTLMAASAFAPQPHIITSSSSSSKTSKTLKHDQQSQILPALPLGGHELYDLHQSMSHLVDATLSSVSSTSNLLSDAAAAVVEEEQGGGLWESYLEIFKNFLNLVHSTIDQPLRSAGWDQTWGVSIFLFTIRKYLKCDDLMILYRCVFAGVLCVLCLCVVVFFCQMIILSNHA